MTRREASRNTGMLTVPCNGSQPQDLHYKFTVSTCFSSKAKYLHSNCHCFIVHIYYTISIYLQCEILRQGFYSISVKLGTEIRSLLFMGTLFIYITHAILSKKRSFSHSQKLAKYQWHSLYYVKYFSIKEGYVVLIKKKKIMGMCQSFICD